MGCVAERKRQEEKRKVGSRAWEGVWREREGMIMGRMVMMRTVMVMMVMTTFLT